VEKALQKLQSARPVPEPLPTRSVESAPPAPAHLAPAPVSPVQALPPAREFDPRNHTGKVVAIDRARLRALNMLPPETHEREIASQFRAIKRPLLRQVAANATSAERVPHNIMVTSALPGDGKTFTSLNLAMSLALEMDFTALLVDGDAPKPHLTR